MHISFKKQSLDKVSLGPYFNRAYPPQTMQRQWATSMKASCQPQPILDGSRHSPHTLASLPPVSDQVGLKGIPHAVSEPTVTLQLPTCGHNKRDHLMCEILVLIKTRCGEKEMNGFAFSLVSIFLLAVALCLILASSGSILYKHAIF